MKLSDLLKSAETRTMTLDVNGEQVSIEYRSTGSDEFVSATARHQQAMAKLAAAGEKLTETKVVMGVEISEPTEIYEKLISILLSSLIASWGFDDDLTLESAATFLHANRAIRSSLDKAAAALGAHEQQLKKMPLPAQ